MQSFDKRKKRTAVVFCPVKPYAEPPRGLIPDLVLTEVDDEDRVAAYYKLFKDCADQIIVISMAAKAIPDGILERLLDNMHSKELEYIAVNSIYCSTDNRFIEAFTINALNAACSHDAALFPSGQLNGYGLHREKSIYPATVEEIKVMLENAFTGLDAEYPSGITVDMTSRCNLHCKKCIYHGTNGEIPPIERKDMPSEMFEQLVEEVSGWERVPFLTLAMRGEPLLNRNLGWATALLKKHAIPFGIVTNGVLLEREVLSLLCENGLHDLTVSLDTNTSDSFSLNTGLDAFDKVIANLEWMLEESYAGKLSTPMLNFVISNENRHEEQAFLKRWKSRFKIVKVGQYQDLYSNRKPEALFFPAGPTLPCPSAWSSMYIFSDGSLRRCCQDDTRFLPLGMFPETSLQNIWTGSSYHTWRDSLLRDNNEAKEFCMACMAWSKWLAYTVRVDGILKRVTPLVTSHVQPPETWAETVKRNRNVGMHI